MSTATRPDQPSNPTHDDEQVDPDQVATDSGTRRGPAGTGRSHATPDALPDEPEDPPTGGDQHAYRRGAGPARPRTGLIALALTAVLGLVLGYAAGWLTPKLGTPGDDSVEAGFSRDMIFHHAQAVEMGLIGFQRATDPAVRQIAVDIATTQQGEIGMMHAWLDRWKLDPTGSAPAMAWMPDGAHHMGAAGLMPGMANAAEMARLRASTGKDLDVLFLQLMIRHHLGGVHMIDAVLAAGAEPEVLRAARTMKNVQQTELANLEDLLTRHGGTPLPTG